MDPWLGVSAEDPVYGPPGEAWYFMLPLPWTDGRMPDGLDPASLASIPLFYEDPGFQEHRTSVGFWDGSVRSLDDAEFEAFIDVARGVPLGIEKP